jgi:hypothetical protein
MSFEKCKVYKANLFSVCVENATVVQRTPPTHLIMELKVFPTFHLLLTFVNFINSQGKFYKYYVGINGTFANRINFFLFTQVGAAEIQIYFATLHCLLL